MMKNWTYTTFPHGHMNTDCRQEAQLHPQHHLTQRLNWIAPWIDMNKSSLAENSDSGYQQTVTIAELEALSVQ
jgi:hypothetical protein